MRESTKAILDRANEILQEKIRQGWTKQDFAEALRKMLMEESLEPIKGTNNAEIASDNPGGDRARDNGCSCDSFLNCHGYGCYDGFNVDENCPIHGPIKELYNGPVD
jgi:hypothetical protein